MVKPAFFADGCCRRFLPVGRQVGFQVCSMKMEYCCGKSSLDEAGFMI